MKSFAVSAFLAAALLACSSGSDPSRFDLDQPDTTPASSGDALAGDDSLISPDGQPDDVDPTDVATTQDSDSPGPDDAPQPPLDSAPDGERITVATWNVRRLFDTVCDSGVCGDNAFESAYSQAQFDFKISQVVSGIQRLDADIVLLQEVENGAALDALAAALSDQYDFHVLGETNFDASLDTAVLARGELIQVTSHRGVRIPRPLGGTTSFAREFLEVEFSLQGQRIIVFNAHFKSQNDDDPDRRLAEALAAADIVAARIAERPDASVVLGGDLNDVPGSAAINAINEVAALLRAASELGDGDGTVEFNGQANALDHIYVCTTCPWTFIPGTAAVVRSSGSAALSGSDHAGLRASIGPRGRP